MPLQETSGAASYDAFGGGSAAVPQYIEDVFSTWLIKPSADFTNYSINNGIDLSTKGGMTWFKARDAAQNNLIYDTARGSSSGSPNALITNGTQAQQTAFFDYVTPNTNGFTVNYLSGGGQLTNSGINYASWTFREQPKFFDVVTYTGNGSLPNQLISHNLGSVPGFIVIKATNAARDWITWHRGNGTTNYGVMSLNMTAASGGSLSSGDLPTATQFKPGAFFDPNYNNANETGITYVAYLFAHDAGGFGLTGTDNVISCGSFTTTPSATINLGYEPQWLMVKRTDSTGNWFLADNMRGITADSADVVGWANLAANTSGTEANDNGLGLTSTGFKAYLTNGTYIYIAIRKGPMKVPTDATKVFSPVAFTGTNTTTVINAGFPMDMVWIQARNTNAVLGGGAYDLDRLRGNVNRLFIPSTSAESASLGSPYDTFDNMTGLGSDGTFFNNSAINYSDWFFRRAPSFFDEVCETSTSSTNKSVTHNLAAVPELMIVKTRSAAGTNWVVYASSVTTLSQYLVLNTTAAKATSSNIWGLSSPTTTTFNINESTVVGGTGRTYVAYLFATCPAVSKVGSYTGTGTTLQVNCGFTGGARFVLIKRTDSTGDWYVWDTARGIVAGNDPYLLMNSTAAEVTSTDYIDTYSAGFEISSTAPAAINASGGTFIFLAIA